jgi:hypothetical protein
MFGVGPAWSSKADLFLKLAGDCGLRAKDLKYRIMAQAMEPAKAPQVLTWKGFWKHVPVAKLYRELEVPVAISYKEAEALLRCAYLVRDRYWSHPDRYFEREYKSFRKSKSANPLTAARWSALLDKLLLGNKTAL